jgi:hypothetical protein
LHLSKGRLGAEYDASAHWLLSTWGDSIEHILSMPAALVHDPRRSSVWRRLFYRAGRKLDRRACCHCDRGNLLMNRLRQVQAGLART